MQPWQPCLPELAGPERLRAWAPHAWAVGEGWAPLLHDFFASDTGLALGRFVQARLQAGATIYPSEPLTALALTPLHAVKVLILGQDPYHGEGQAHGLAFSVPPGTRVPPSLRNIFKEIERERQLGQLPSRSLSSPEQASDGCLIRWASQGVLLLNTCLSVEAQRPASHAKQGWETLTRRLVQAVLDRPVPLVVMLWGAHAQGLGDLMSDVARPDRSLRVLQANHPSPLSATRGPAPFIGCGHFAQANAFLTENGLPPIHW